MSGGNFDSRGGKCGCGIGTPPSRILRRCTSIAVLTRWRSRTSASVWPVAPQPGRSGTYAPSRVADVVAPLAIERHFAVLDRWT